MLMAQGGRTCFYGVVVGRLFHGGIKKETKLKMVYSKGDKFWVGKLLEHPEIMT